MNQNFKVTPDLYASMGNRFANFFIDRIVFMILLFGLTIVLSTVYYALSTDTEAVDEFLYNLENINPILDRLLTALIFVILYMISEVNLKGKTVGKYITKTKVVMKDGSEPTTSDYLTRSLCRMIPLEAFSFLGREARGWHDSISNTYVIDEVRFNRKRKKLEAQANEIKRIETNYD